MRFENPFKRVERLKRVTNVPTGQQNERVSDKYDRVFPGGRIANKSEQHIHVGVYRDIAPKNRQSPDAILHGERVYQRGDEANNQFKYERKGHRDHHRSFGKQRTQQQVECRISGAREQRDPRDDPGDFRAVVVGHDRR